MASDKTATFAINLESNAAPAAAEDAAQLEKLRATIHGSQDAVKQYGAALRSLRGDSDEVKAAKAELKAKIDAERDALSRANLALIKQGVTYEKLAEQTRKVAREKEKLKAEAEKRKLEEVRAGIEKLTRGTHAAGGPVATLAGHMETLRGVLSGARGSLGAFALAGGALVAVLAALAAGAVAAAVAFGKWALEGANAARSMNLVRQAASGSAENAANLGTQVDALAARVPTAKERLNELGAELARTLNRTTVSGQGIVDTFNLVGQASAAMGDDVGRSLGDIVERGKQFGRIQIHPLELQGTGVGFEDVAGELAKQMRVGVAQARAALFEGRVGINQGAAALRAAVEKNFAGINTKQLLDVNVQVEKLHEKFQALTRGIHLEPLLEGLDRLSKLFDVSTVAGQALQTIVTDFGNAFAESFARDGVPTLEKFVKSLVIAGLKLDIEFLRMKKQVLDFIAKFERLLTLRTVVTVFAALIGGLTAAFAALAIATIEFWGPFALIAAGVAGLIALMPTLYKWWIGLADAINRGIDDVAALGEQIITGLVHGITAGWHKLVDSVTAIGEGIKDRFKKILGISSPSKVFAVYGQQTAAGFSAGLSSAAPAAADAAEALAPGPPGGASAVGARSLGRVQNTFVFQVAAGGGKGEDIAQALSDPSFLAKLTRAVEEAMLGLGLPTGEAP